VHDIRVVFYSAQLISESENLEFFISRDIFSVNMFSSVYGNVCVCDNKLVLHIHVVVWSDN
jgi:hypothetical protein